ncbi:MAG TPA: response regulator [Gemmatimonadaceae bacterium]|jgi:two-component system LytT family response regulator|nr:response regulator [Gemmatimonadaceae bacterium]
MRALIVDDEAPARSKLRRLLSAAEEVEVVGEARTGREAVAAIKRSRPDVVFLDIQMPGLDGFGVLETIADDAPYVVFVTADDRHAIRAFEVGAVDYLLKPYTPQRFDQVLERARARMSTATRSDDEPPTSTRAPLQRLLVIEDGRAVFLAVDRIDRIEAERNYVTLVSGPNRYRLRATLGAVADRLDRAHFLRINRSTLVRLDAVRTMHEWSHGDFRVVMHDGAELVWSRRYRAAAEREFGLDG